MMKLDLIARYAGILVCAVWVLASARTTVVLRNITRRSVAHTRRLVWLIKIIAMIVGAGTIFGLSTDFGLHWLLGGFLSTLVVLFALTDKVEAIVPTPPPQNRLAYSRAWQEYKRLRKDAVIPAILLVLLGLSWIALTAELQTRLTSHTLNILFWIVIFAAIVLLVTGTYNGWKLTYWACPRCGHCFRSLWVASIMPKQCNHCGLRQWAENP
jgi:hypothetical protein